METSEACRGLQSKGAILTSTTHPLPIPLLCREAGIFMCTGLPLHPSNGAGVPCSTFATPIGQLEICTDLIESYQEDLWYVMGVKNSSYLEPTW